MNTFYRIAKFVVYSVFKPLYRIEVIGIENIPKDGAVLLCSNHIDNFDPPMVGITTPRQVRFMAKEELFKIPILGMAIRNLGAFPVKRGFADRDAIRTGLKVLKNGEVLGIFPEGTRSKTGKLGKGLAGAGFFALRSDSVVIPSAIIGPYKPFRKVKVVYGKPIDFKNYRERKISAEEATEVIMKEIQNLLDKHQ